MSEKNENFPDAFQAGLLVLGLFSVECLVRAAFHDLRGLLPENKQDLGAGIVVLGNGCIFTFLMHFKGLRYRDLFHSTPASATATFFLLLLPIALTVPALNILISSLTQVLIALFPMSNSEQSMFGEMMSGSLGSIVLVCVLAPLLEEMLFRGIILRSFLRQYPRWWAIAGSAALFGMAHLNIYQFVAGVIAGTFLGWLYERTRSLIPCITLHCIYNASFVAIAMTPSSDSTPDRDWLPLLIAAFISCSIGGYLLRRLLLPAAR